MPGSARQTHQLQRLFNLATPLFLGNAEIEQRQIHIFCHAQIVDQIEVLKNKSDVGLAQVHQIILRTMPDFLAIEVVVAAGGTVDHAYDV